MLFRDWFYSSYTTAFDRFCRTFFIYKWCSLPRTSSLNQCVHLSLYKSFFDVVSVTLTMHAFIKGDGMDFKIDRVPAHSSWIHQFSLQAVQTRNSSNDVMYFVYPRDKTQQCSKSVTRQGLLADFNCFPQDFFFASTINQSYYRKLFLVNQGQKPSYGISLDDYPNCCSQTIKDYFFANLSLASKYC